MTMPSLISNINNKQNQVALKKAYSLLQQTLLMYQKDTEEVPRPSAFNANSNSLLKYKILPYFNEIKDCGKGTGKTACAYFNSSGVYDEIIYRTYDGKTAMMNFFDDGQFIIADGMMYFFENAVGSDKIYISVDVNGMKKKPNQLGRDLFTFQLMDDGKLLPMGATGTDFSADDYCRLKGTTGYNGIACTSRALYDKTFWKN